MKNCFNEEYLDTVRNIWAETAVFTDGLENKKEFNVPFTSLADREVKVISEDCLRPDEFASVEFNVGSYTVKSSWNVYIGSPQNPYSEEDREIYQNMVECIKNDLKQGRTFETCKKLHRIANSIYAKRTGSDDFKPICKTAGAKFYGKYEYVGAFYSVKESESSPDEDEVLMVLGIYVGGYFSVDTWYKLDSTGRVEKYKIHPFIESRHWENT